MSKRRLLVVDDDDSVIDYLQAMLEDRYDVLTCMESSKVLGLAKQQKPDLILCDIDMPGMDGGDVSAALYADDKTRAIPVLFLSGLLKGQKEVGGRPAVSKNAPVGELVARIEALL